MFSQRNFLLRKNPIRMFSPKPSKMSHADKFKLSMSVFISLTSLSIVLKTIYDFVEPIIGKEKRIRNKHQQRLELENKLKISQKYVYDDNCLYFYHDSQSKYPDEFGEGACLGLSIWLAIHFLSRNPDFHPFALESDRKVACKLQKQNVVFPSARAVLLRHRLSLELFLTGNADISADISCDQEYERLSQQSELLHFQTHIEEYGFKLKAQTRKTSPSESVNALKNIVDQVENDGITRIIFNAHAETGDLSFKNKRSGSHVTFFGAYRDEEGQPFCTGFEPNHSVIFGKGKSACSEIIKELEGPRQHFKSKTDYLYVFEDQNHDEKFRI
jgi:hypothetical protein